MKGNPKFFLDSQVSSWTNSSTAYVSMSGASVAYTKSWGIEGQAFTISSPPVASFRLLSGGSAIFDGPVEFMAGVTVRAGLTHVGLDGSPVAQKTITIEKPIIKNIYHTEVVPMSWTLGNVLIVAAICIVTMAIWKRVTFKAVVKTVVKVIVWPFSKLARRGVKEAQDAWTEAEREERAKEPRL